MHVERWRDLGLLALAAPALLSCGDSGYECLDNVECVEECGGPAVQVGCDACPAGSFDSAQCAAGGGGAGGGGAGGETTGGGGTGGAPTCDIPECDVAINCLSECGGMLVTLSCCPCEPPLVDAASCLAGGGGAGGGG